MLICLINLKFRRIDNSDPHFEFLITSHENREFDIISHLLHHDQAREICESHKKYFKAKDTTFIVKSLRLITITLLITNTFIVKSLRLAMLIHFIKNILRHDWIYYNGVTFSIALLQRGRAPLSGLSGQRLTLKFPSRIFAGIILLR